MIKKAKIITILTSLLFVYITDSAKAVIDDIQITPDEPTTEDIITVETFGTETRGAVTVIDSFVNITDTHIGLDLTLKVGFAYVITPWSYSEDIGIFPAGTYDLTVRTIVDSNVKDSYFTTFQVVPEPAMTLDGSGTQEDPWLIQSLEDFNDFVADANYWDDYTRLETDVNLAGQTYPTAVIAPDTDTGPLFQGTAFTGHFDGNDHIIHNADVYMPFSNYVGLFGYVGSTGRIHSLVLEGLTITGETHAGGLAGVNEGSITDCSTSGSVEGTQEGDNIGGLVGSNLGSITDCYSTCSVNAIDECDNMGGLVGFNSGNVTDCYASGPVDGSDCHRLGGLVGLNEGSLTGCYSTGSVRSGSRCGGLVGMNLSGTITNCYATGRVEGDFEVGGLLAVNRGIVSECYATGDVNGVEVVGGLVGFYLVGITSNCYSTGDVSGERTIGGLIGDFLMGNVSNCHSTGNVKASEYVGGLIGHTDINGEISNCFWDTDTQTHGVTESIGVNDGTATNVASLPTDQMQTESTFTDADWDFINVWNIGENQTYPYLRTVSPGDINKDHITNFFDIRILCDQWLEEE